LRLWLKKGRFANDDDDDDGLDERENGRVRFPVWDDMFSSPRHPDPKGKGKVVPVLN
jgi:hypothetical protein